MCRCAGAGHRGRRFRRLRASCSSGRSMVFSANRRGRASRTASRSRPASWCAWRRSWRFDETSRVRSGPLVGVARCAPTPQLRARSLAVAAVQRRNTGLACSLAAVPLQRRRSCTSADCRALLDRRVVPRPVCLRRVSLDLLVGLVRAVEDGPSPRDRARTLAPPACCSRFRSRCSASSSVGSTSTSVGA